jgi:hypothetical protein
MSQGRDDRYAFDPEFPVPPVAPGRSILVTGSPTSGARELALRLVLAGSPGEGRVLLSTDVTGETLASECEALVADRSAPDLRIVDCSRRGDRPADGANMSVHPPNDLTGIGVDITSILEEFYREDVTHTRVGIDSISGLLGSNEFRPVSRFVNALIGRLEAIDALGVFVLDTATTDDRAVDAVRRFCDAHVEVRVNDDGQQQLRTRGLPDGTTGWAAFSVELQWPRPIGGHLLDRQVTMGETVSTRYGCLRCDFSATDDLDLDEALDRRCG